MTRCFPLLALLFLFLTGCDTASTIINNIPERDANEIMVLLSTKGIHAMKIAAPKATTGAGSAEQMWNISVQAADITEAMSILNQAGLPRQKGTTLLDLFGTSGLVPSDMQDKIRYQEGLSEQLASTIRKMDGVLDANVQITFPQSDETPAQHMTASVFVRYRGMGDAPTLLITRIKRLVSCSLPGLAMEHVCVITDRAPFTDTFTTAGGPCDEQRGYVSVWGLTITKESLPLFRLIFYSFLIALFILLAALIWVIWLFHPLLKQKGGAKAFFAKEPYQPNDFIATSTPPPVVEGE
jgi:type III secretion protein J